MFSSGRTELRFSLFATLVELSTRMIAFPAVFTYARLWDVASC